MKSCERCHNLPAPTAESGVLYLCPPEAHPGDGLAGFLDRVGVAYSAPAPRVFAVELVPGLLKRLGEGLSEAFSPTELRDARALLLKTGRAPTLADLVRMQPLADLVAKLRGDWLVQMIREDRLVSHFQPIVCAHDPARVFAHECLLRGIERDGTLVSPARMYDVARASDVLFHLDRAARLRAIRGAVEAGISSRIFINFNPTSLYDPASCLRTTIAAVEEVGIEPGRVVFEVVESDKAPYDLNRIFAVYRDAGFRVALDDLGAGYGSLNLLGTLKPDFVKLDMALIRDVDRDPYKAGITAKLVEMAQRLGVSTVAEGVETPEEFDWVERQGVDFVQGYLLAKPACPPPLPRPLPGRRAAPSSALLAV